MRVLFHGLSHLHLLAVESVFLGVERSRLKQLTLRCQTSKAGREARLFYCSSFGAFVLVSMHEAGVAQATKRTLG